VRLRKVFGALVVLGALEGCSIKGDCEQDSQCPDAQYCHTTAKVCSAPRYSALKLLAPDEIESSIIVGGGPRQLQARLLLSAGARAVYPPQLDLTVTPSTGGTPTTLTLQNTGEGIYSVDWTPPPGEGVYTFQLAHPESWGPSRTVQVTVDRTPPSLTLQVPEAQPAAAKDGFSYVDPMADKAWARDQTVPVRVESDSADLDPAGLRVVVRGHNGGAEVTGLPVVQVTPCNGKAFCGSVDVPMWRPGLDAFRGSFQIEVTAKDRVGNENSASGSIPVTRWKWAFNGASGPVLTTPAIGEKGAIYFGTSDTNGKVFALTPDGTKKWEKQLGGAVLSSPAVGKNPDGTDRLYVAVTAKEEGDLFALGADGTTLGNCLPEGSVKGPINAAVALTSSQVGTEPALVETAIAKSTDTSILALRLDSPLEDKRCSGAGETSTTLPGASVVVKGTDAYFADSERREVPSYTLAPDGFWRPKSGYTFRSYGVNAMGLGFAGGDYLVGAGGFTTTAGDVTGGLFAFTPATGGFRWMFPRNYESPAPMRNMAIGAGNVLFFGREVEAGAEELTAIDLLAETPRISVPNAGSFPGAPVLGTSGYLYTASSTSPTDGIGEVTAWSAGSLTMRWKLSDSVGRAQVSPSLDCIRGPDGTPTAEPHGILYVPSTNGQLYAFIVDSAGLDKSAPWPKYQHDARNTGNPDNPITNCR